MARFRQKVSWVRRCLAAAGLVVVCLGAGGVAAAEEFLAGQMLASAPEMRDPNFARTVVYMLRHDQGGALGLVINRPLGEVPVTLLLEGKDSDWSGSERVMVHSGGPVGPERFISLHSRDLMPGSSHVVSEALAYTDGQEVLMAIRDGKGPKRTFFALGYSGWGPGQLESELERGDWLVIPGNLSILFEEDHDKRWEAAVALYTPEL
jgi:putative transcriptional regulator